MYVCIYIYIYTYIHTYIHMHTYILPVGTGGCIRPVHLLRVVLLRVLESYIPGDPLSKFTDMRIPPLRIKSPLESNPLKPELLVGGLGVG